MHIRKLSSGEENIWDNYVTQHPEASFYHFFGWKEVIENSMGCEGIYLTASDSNHEIVGIYPLFILKTGLFGSIGISLPYVNYGGILSNSPEIENLLISEAEAIGHEAGCRYIELRQRYPLKTDLTASSGKVTSIIKLQGGPEKVFSRLHQNVRNKVRKAKKNKVVVQTGAEYLSEFYDIYAKNLRDLGTPVWTRRFFEYIVDTFPLNVRVYRATRLGKTIGAKLTLIDRNTCYYVGIATIRENLCYAPVHAMNWAAIEDACMAGCALVDFGRSTEGSTHHNFKKYWGGETHTLPWSYQLLTCKEIPTVNKENPNYALAIALWKRLPVMLTKLIGPGISRRLP